MTASPQSGGEPPEHSRRFWLILLSRPITGFLIALLAALAGAGWWFWHFVHEDLAPLVERNLSQTLNRPVELGPVTGFSLTRLRFGQSTIPPFTTRLGGRLIQDADSVKAEAIEVNYNLFDLLLKRELNLDVTLVQPNLYIDQAADGRWLITPISPQEGRGPISTTLESIRLRQGTAIVAPNQRPAQTLRSLDGLIAFARDSQQLRFDLGGQVATGGSLEVAGTWFRPNQRVILAADAENLAAPALSALLPQLPVQVRAGRVNADIQAQYQENQPLQLDGTARLANVTAVVPDRLLLRSSRPTPRTFEGVNGTIQFLPKSPGLGFDLSGQLAAGGKLRVKGESSGLDFRRLNAALQVQNLPARVLDGAFKLPIQPLAGTVAGNLNLQLRPNQQPNLKGTAQLQNVDAQIAQIPQRFRNASGQLRFTGGLTTVLENVRGLYGQVPFQASGAIDPQQGYDLTAQSSPVAIGTALQTLKVTLPFATAGRVQAENLRVTGPIDNPVLTGLVSTLGTSQVDRVPLQSLTARFQLDAPLVRVTDIQAVPVAGGVIKGQARYNLGPAGRGLVANLQAQNVPGDAIARLYGVAETVTVGRVNAQAQISGPPGNLETAVQFRAPEATYATTGEVVVREGRTFLRNIVAQVAGGTVRASGQIVDGLLQANVNTAGVPLRQFSQQLRGQLSGQLQVAGPVAALRPENIRAQGKLRFSQGLSLIQEPITAQVRFNGENILVQEATAPGFSANGLIATRFRGPGAPQITALDLNVRADDYSLAALPAVGPTNVQLAGEADLVGRLTGSPTAPNFNGSLVVTDLALNQIAFESRLSGRISYSGERQLDLRLAGDQDRINLALGPNFQPESFYIRREEAIATGRRAGDQLLVDVEQFPLAALNLQPGQLGPIAGLAAGDFVYNLQTRSLTGDLEVERPSLGTLVGDRFVGQVRFADGVATLTGGELQLGQTRYQVSAQFIPGANPQFSGQVDVAQAEIQDILTALQFFDIDDLRRGLQPPVYGNAADVQTVGVGAPEAPLLTQLRRLSEIQTLIDQQVARREEASPLPPLADLLGKLNGQIRFAGSQQAGVEANFSLRGQDVNWGRYAFDQVVADGRLADGTVSFSPLRIVSGERFAAFSGQLGQQQLVGQLVLNDIPVEALNQFTDLPLDVAGNLDGSITLAGSLTNPQAQGQFSLDSAAFNGTTLRTAAATFAYRDARLNLNSTSYLEGSTEPVQISGSIPYVLPFASTLPATNQVNLDLYVQDEGLALLNLFTDQITWVNGQGVVNLQVRGTLEQPLVNGLVALDNATLRAQALAEPVTNATGTIRFNRDFIQVERLAGRFSDGQVVAAGILPIFDPAAGKAAAASTPLSISLQDLDLKLKGLFRGDVGGNLVVTGTAFSPVLGGTVQLSDGQVVLANLPQLQGTTSAPSGAETDSATAAPGFSGLQFNNLRVNLANDLQISYPPVLNFVASGDVLLNGSFENLRPQGRVSFRQGQVNLFTTRFRLNRQEENYAQFLPNQGLDPFLNLNLITTVTEVVRPPVTEAGIVEGRPVTALGAIDSVRIRAEVEGQASELINNFRNTVELSSSPGRSEEEIIGLIGGGFANTQGEGDATLALANIAGSAFFSNIQGFLDNALGSRADFRLFPTLTPTETGNSVLGLGAELGYDITNRFTASILQVLTTPENPTQLNLRYQVSDQVQVRSGITLEGETFGAIEYRTRF